MLNRDPQREAPRPPQRRRWGAMPDASLANEGLSAFRRAYRWLNLTLVQHGIWPLLVVVFGAPSTPIGLTPLPWFWARLAAPLLAVLLALAYLAQRPEGTGERAAAAPGTERGDRLREQATVLIVGVTVAVAILRLLQGPVLPVLKLELFGLAEVAAFQIINFGVVGRAIRDGGSQAWPVALFAVSWGLRDGFLAASTPETEHLVLAFLGGAVIGLAVGAVSWLLRRWPGPAITAAALQFLAIYLVFGFLS